MNPHPRKSGKWLWCVLLLASLGMLLWVPVKTMIDVTAVQNAVNRDWEISFGYSNGTDVPAFLSPKVDSAVESFFEQRYGYRGYTGEEDPKTRNRDIVYHERFRALFRGSIEEIHIYYFEGFRGDLGAALARFPKLRSVSVEEVDEGRPSEPEWTHFCKRLRELPNLERLEIGGDQLTDAAIIPLAGHPQLREITVLFGRLTEGSMKTFASMPHLSKLHIEGQRYKGDVWLSQERQEAVRAALPSVTLELLD